MSGQSSPRTAYHPHANGAVSAEITAANARLLATRQQQSVTRETPPNAWLAPLRNAATSQPRNPATAAPLTNPATSQPISTDLLLAFLKHNTANEGRVWLLSRALDTKGQGWLSVETLRAQLTHKASKTHICGWRRLRQILAAGDKRFWQRDKQGRIWLRSQARVALALGVTAPKFKHIALPLTSLTGSLAQAKANFYAAVHSGRGSAEKTPNPISRITLRHLTAIPERSQQRYDAAVAINKKQATAIGAIYQEETHQQYAWEGKALFKFTDRCGKIGVAGESYSAWRLPNQYEPHHPTITTAASKRLRRQIKHHSFQSSITASNEIAPADRVTDLAIIRAQGNSDTVTGSKCYFRNGATLSKQVGRGYLFDVTSGLWLKVG